MVNGEITMPKSDHTRKLWASQILEGSSSMEVVFMYVLVGLPWSRKARDRFGAEERDE